MASNTQATTKKRAWHTAKGGRKRKNHEARHSTPSYAELFAGCGEPGKPVAAQTAKKS